MRGTTVMLALAVAGCMVVDGRPEVHLSPPGPIYTSGSVTFQVDAAGATEAWIAVDGREIDVSHPVGQPFATAFAGTAAGQARHRVVARVYDGALASDSAPVDVIVHTRAPRFTVSPPGGTFFSAVPFVVTLDFDEDLDPASVSPETVRLERVSDPAQPVPATVSISADRRHVTLAAASPLDRLGEVELVVNVRDPIGFVTSSRGPRWNAPPLGVRWSGILSEAVAGVISLTAQWYAAAPSRVDVLLNGTAIGSLAPSSSLAWDTRLWPDGVYRLELFAPGYASDVWRVVVDNTPPRLVSCEPGSTPPDDAFIRDFVRAVFSECVCNGSYCDSSYCHLTVSAPAPLGLVAPTAYRFTFPTVHDVAGNVLPAGEGCTVNYPAWRRPWGTAALAVPGAGPSVALGINRVTQVPDTGEVLFVSPATLLEPANVRRALSSVPGPWDLDPSPLNSGPLAADPQLRVNGYSSAMWLEDINGTWTIRAWAAQPPVEIPVSTSPVVLARGAGNYGWVETSPTGVREARIAVGKDSLGAWVISPPANVNAGADAASPWVSRFADLYSDETAVAFLETVPGGIPQLRARCWQGGVSGQWVSVGDVLNRDASLAASEPSLAWSSTPIVAWVEGGRVLVRRGDAAGNWGPAEDLLADPGTSASSPRILGPWIVFVAHGLDGDRFETRAWGGGAWISRVPLTASGAVTSWEALSSPLAITWTDGSGGPYLMVYNE